MQKVKHFVEVKKIVCKNAMNNGWYTHVFQILRKERDGKFIFKVNLLSRLTNPVEISRDWALTNFKYQEPEFYSRLFGEAGKGPFEVPMGHTKKY